MLWRSLLIRSLVNFVAIFLTVLIMPGFSIIDPWLGSPDAGFAGRGARPGRCSTPPLNRYCKSWPGV